MLPWRYLKDIINRLFDTLHGNETKFCEGIYLSPQDCKHFGRYGALGTHGHEHIPMARRGIAKLREAISLSIHILETVTQKKIESMSFPFGGKTAFNEPVIDIARTLGIKVGFTTNRDINNGLSEPLSLSRYGNNDIPGCKRQIYNF